jgi:hypothetical protein
MVHDDDLRADLAAQGFAQRIGPWSETEHVHRYMELIAERRQARASRRLDPGAPAATPQRTRRPASTRSRIG